MRFAITGIFSSTALIRHPLPYLEICKVYDLGTPSSEPNEVKGGRLHQLWLLETTTGKYAVKVINEENLQLLAKNVLSPQKAQDVAAYMQQKNIPTVTAYKHNGERLFQRAKKVYVVMPWIEGRTLSDANITCSMTKLIGNLLANIQQKKNTQLFSVPDWTFHTLNGWQKLLRPLRNLNLTIVERLHVESTNLAKWSQEAELAAKELNQELVVSHRDLDPSNVIWQSVDAPILIDWEYAGLIHPTLDLLIVALNWSELLSGKIQPAKFCALISGYYANRPTRPLTPSVFAGYFGYCLDWLDFNIRKLATIPEAATEILQTLNALHLVQAQQSQLIRWYNQLI